MTDPTYTHDMAPRELEKLAEEEHRRAEDSGGNIPMLISHFWCNAFGYGRTSMWPPYNPSRPHAEFKDEFAKHGRLVGQRWLKLNRLVLGKEREIQETIIKLTDGDIKDGQGNTLNLEHYLERSWEMARDVYNAEHVATPGPVEGDFYLDPQGSITVNHSDDLDVFALDFLRDLPFSVITPAPRRQPLYRHGANYLDDRELLDQYLEDPEAVTWTFPKPSTSGPVTYNQDVQKFLQKHRATFLVPHINMEDLTNPLNLLMFIHHRARFAPREFASLDNDLIYLGKNSQILSGACDPSCYVSFHDREGIRDSDVPGLDPRIWYKHNIYTYKMTDEAKHFEWGILLGGGNAFGSMEAWLIMQSQAITFLFLSSFCEQMLNLAQETTVKDPLQTLSDQELFHIECVAAQRINTMRHEKQTETWQDMESIRQYEPIPNGTNFSKYLSKFATKRLDAEEHIKRLFDEPDYFVNHIIEQKEHHWTNLRMKYDPRRGTHIERYSYDEAYRHNLYLDCIRSVLRRAFFEFFIWNTIGAALEDLANFEKEHPPRQSGPTYIDGAKVWPRVKWSHLETRHHDEFYKKYGRVQVLVRYAATFFVYEFRKKAIHAASEPMRNIYCVTGLGSVDPPEKLGKFLAREFYDSNDIVLSLRSQARPSEREHLPRIVAELIENFISHESSSLFVGMRKVTARIQKHIDDCEDDEMRKNFSNLLCKSVDGLDVLSEVAEHMDLHFPCMFVMMHWKSESEEKRRASFSSSLSTWASLDFLAFDKFAFELNRFPEKRTTRIFRFLDEMQGFLDKIPGENLGKAKGDIKRFGSSLLHKFIYPLNKQTPFQADDATLQRLTKYMGISKNQWPFDRNEMPWDFNKDLNLAADERAENLEIWKKLKKELTEQRKRSANKIKNAWKQEADTPASSDDPVSSWLKRKALLEERVKNKRKNWKEKRQRQKEEWRRRHQVISRQLEDEDMQDLTSPEASPAGGNDDVQAVQEHVQQLHIEPQPQPQAQPRPQQQLPPAPPPRQLPTPQVRPPQQPLGLAPDGNPKGILNKNCWEIWTRILLGEIVYTKKNNKKGKERLPSVRWGQVETAVRSIEFVKTKAQNTGSHYTFQRTSACRWPSGLVDSFTLSHPHGKSEGPNAVVAPFKMRIWKDFLNDRGFTYELLKKWYRQK
ncbi:hypothetical protein FSARC_5764 [Fusarium sarcochroum]|uniref:Uncharacterized protein n=1 Tax=Fusarium sarcochroum TaxID=1208366 RepID=A0A8H4TYQ7_9HYPO|nr:hypothetical protein FSARC_5764 [Fusarium sarcochroum]